MNNAYKIEGKGARLLATISAELVKNGVAFNAVIKEDISEEWTITLTGGF